MKKILTIFERDWEGNRAIINQYIDGFDVETLKDAEATEKLDGTNVRVTVRNKMVVRVEKRRNPDKIQKHKGIEEPWYADATDGDQRARSCCRVAADSLRTARSSAVAVRQVSGDQDFHDKTRRAR